MTTHGPVRWCRVNLFATPLDILLSCVFLPLTFFMVWKLGAWVLLQAKWSIIADNLRVLMVGTFPWNTWGGRGMSQGACCRHRRDLGLVAKPQRIGVAALVVVLAAAMAVADYTRTAGFLACVTFGMLPWAAVSRFVLVHRLVQRPLAPSGYSGWYQWVWLWRRQGWNIGAGC